jgi:release factor glutamine methyltransferase
MDEIWTVEKVLTWTSQHFNLKQIPDPRLSAELLLSRVLNSSRVDLYIQFERILTENEREQYRKVVKRRLAREPVQYILGETEFMGFPFKISPEVFIPRPETELLVDTILETIAKSQREILKILDIGTGSGCIAISLAKLLPQSKIYAVEKSIPAIKIARENAALNKVELQFIEGDIFTRYKELPGPFDVIVSNPPYIGLNEKQSLAPEVNLYEPKEALYCGESGFEFYNGLKGCIFDLLNPDGKIFLEMGFNQSQKVGLIFQKEGYNLKFKKDYNQIERIITIERSN